MALVIMFWTVKILALAGVVFSLYSIIRPRWMTALFIKMFLWKMKWCGFQGTVAPGKNAAQLIRLWSVVMALIFLGINYIFGNVITIGYVMK